MYLYVYEGYCGGRGGQQRTEELVHRSAELYMKEVEKNLGDASCQILRAERGKPYFKEVPIEFSVSHTGSLWVCLMDEEPVGVDIQEIRKCRYDKIAERYYTPDERAYIEEMGEGGFFQIWTRKEAYAKYTGEGITEEIKHISTLKNTRVKFMDFSVKEGVKGSCCLKEKKELWIRKIT